jgi:hypothetical protein
MILIQVFGAVDTFRLNDFAHLVYEEFSSRGHRTKVVVQTVSGSCGPIIIDKEGQSIAQEMPYTLVFGFADTMTRGIYADSFQLWSHEEKTLQKLLGIPVFLIS